MKKLLAMLMALAMVLTMVACGNQNANNDENKNSEDGFDYSSLTIAGIVFQNDEFCRILQQGYEAAAKDYGVNLLMGNSNDSVDKEIELVNTYIASEVDGICVSIMDADASVTALKNAYDKGISVAVTNTLIPGNSNPRVEAVLEQIDDLGYEIVSRQEAWTSEMALQVCQDMLTANPDNNVIYTNCDPNTVGATLAVSNLGRAGEIKVFGVDASDQICGFLLSDDGILQGTAAQQAYDMGYVAMENLIKSLAGEEVESHIYVEPLQLNRGDLDAVQSYKDMLNSLS